MGTPTLWSKIGLIFTRNYDCSIVLFIVNLKQLANIISPGSILRYIEYALTGRLLGPLSRWEHTRATENGYGMMRYSIKVSLYKLIRCEKFARGHLQTWTNAMKLVMVLAVAPRWLYTTYMVYSLDIFKLYITCGINVLTYRFILNQESFHNRSICWYNYH